jgi:hypothetical protein
MTNMKKIIKSLLLIISLFFLLNNTSLALDLISTPIKYELKLNPWQKITKTAKIINKENTEVFITTYKSNATVENNTGKPIFINIWNLNQELASWITIKTNNFIVPPLSDYTIEFDIDVPTNATPWWHYWAVFFRYDPQQQNNLQITSTNAINIKADYWILILVEVDWDIIDSWNPWDTIVTPWWENQWAWWAISPEDNTDNCPYWDFSKSNIDGKCIDEIKIENIIDYIKWTEDDTELNSATEEEDFSVDFSVPFQNDWNTHIKPNWKITFVDEDNNFIKWVWTENILDENWLIIWENITDYLPINQEQSNVLPNSQKIFNQKWKWFPYKTIDENWDIVIKYLSPSKHYSVKNTNNLYPWQRIYNKLERKKITAITDLSYINHDWESIEFNSAKEFYIEYNTERVWYNIYFLITIFFLILLLWFILFIIKKVTKKKCVKCGKYIKKDLKICPYCWTRQIERKKIGEIKSSKSLPKSKIKSKAVSKTTPQTKATTKIKQK